MKQNFLLCWIMIVLLCLSSSTSFAKATDTLSKDYTNSLRQLIGNFYIHESFSISQPIRQMGVTYQRKTYKNLWVGFTYMQWDAMKMFNSYDAMSISDNKDLAWADEADTGKLCYRSRYKMIDVSILYQFVVTQRSVITTGAGVSYCWGKDGYLDYFHQLTVLDATGKYTLRKAHYWGGIATIFYDYLLFDKRLCLGINGSVRYYPNRPRNQYDYGIHIGVNF